MRVNNPWFRFAVFVAAGAVVTIGVVNHLMDPTQIVETTAALLAGLGLIAYYHLVLEGGNGRAKS